MSAPPTSHPSDHVVHHPPQPLGCATAALSCSSATPRSDRPGHGQRIRHVRNLRLPDRFLDTTRDLIYASPDDRIYHSSARGTPPHPQVVVRHDHPQCRVSHPVPRHRRLFRLRILGRQRPSGERHRSRQGNGGGLGKLPCRLPKRVRSRQHVNRFLPTSSEPDVQLGSGFIASFTGTLLLSLGYVELLPVIAPKLAFIQRSALYTVAFVVFTAFGALSGLTDAVFLARQRAKYIFWSDGIIQGTVKVLAPFSLIAAGVYVTYGTFGIFSSFGSAASFDVIASMVLIVVRLGYRLDLRFRLSALTRTLRYTLASYAVSIP